MKNRSLRAVAGPMWLENMLRTSLTTVDVLMLSFFSEQAVAAVGLVNQFVFFIQLMFLMVASGTSILLSQYVGAKQHETARLTSLGSLVLGSGFALVLSVAMALGSTSIIGFYSLEPQVALYAQQFLFIYASGSVFTAFSMIQGSILRAHGHNRSVMLVNMVGNVVNIAGNSLVLFGFWGLPILGVAGVAGSTVFSQLVVCVALAAVIQKHPETRLDLGRMFTIPREVYRKILSVGVPTAGENLSYNFAQMVNLKFISGFGTTSMAAYVYLIAILRYVFINTLTLGSATQIKVGWWVGANETETAQKKAWHYYFVGLAIAVVVIVLLNFTQAWIFPFFTKNPEVLALISSLLLISIVMEAGRTANVIIIPALKGAGDVNFPVIIGVLSMWGIGVAGAWTMGVFLGWGLLGVWVAIAADETLRGLVMLARWRSGKWKGKSFVSSAPPLE